MDKSPSFRTCRKYINNIPCNVADDAIETSLHFAYPLKCRPSGVGGLGRITPRKIISGSPKLYWITGGISAVTSMMVAYFAVHQRNIYNMRMDTNNLNAEKEDEIAKPVLVVRQLGDNFLSGNRMHFLHSVAIMAAPYTSNFPLTTLALFVSGIVTYSGTQYYRAFFSDSDSNVSAISAGGLLLLAGWLSLMI